MKKIANSLTASATVYDAGLELYHLSYARQQHGDEAVLGHLRKDFSIREELTAADASIRAGQFLNDIDRLVNRDFRFADMRHTMDQQARKRKSQMALGEAGLITVRA